MAQKLTLGIGVKQKLSAVQQQRLIQFASLLQESGVDLEARIRRELDENPFLEETSEECPENIVRSDESEITDSERGLWTAGLDTFSETEMTGASVQRNVTPVLEEAGDIPASFENEESFGEFGEYGSSPKDVAAGSDLADNRLDFLGRLHNAEETLESFLLAQLHDLNLDAQKRRLCEYIIGNLSPSGYLEASSEEVLHMAADDMTDGDGTFSELPSEKDFADALALVQTFDPAGVGARSLTECLTLQLQRNGLDCDAVLQDLVEHALEIFETGNIRPFMKRHRLSHEDFESYKQMIRSLNPKPGSGFGLNVSGQVIPDIRIEAVHFGEKDLKSGQSGKCRFAVLINGEGLTNIRLNTVLREKFSNEDRAFCNGKIRDAANLVSLLEQRRRTIRIIAEAMVRRQEKFFETGNRADLKPMTEQNIADDTGVNVTTVSRAVSGKYMETPFGVFEIKTMFSSESGGSGTSSAAIREFIRRSIAAEKTEKPLSDKKLQQMILDTLGAAIAQRTVAKYRDQLGIPSAPKRKVAF
ncbi:MAG: RNA polymerase factor sigma-54 [Desulfovibrionaceae bacterium]|nr:RNA polymerase factor sigma-54 [Desulfovibrionaceae bacterium]